MDKLTKLFKALADRNRLRILAALIQKDELCACQITELLQVTGATASRHMAILLAAKLVDSRKQGRWVYYRIDAKQTEFATLIPLIKAQLQNANYQNNDMRILNKITAIPPEILCQKQRDEK